MGKFRCVKICKLTRSFTHAEKSLSEHFVQVIVNFFCLSTTQLQVTNCLSSSRFAARSLDGITVVAIQSLKLFNYLNSVLAVQASI